MGAFTTIAGNKKLGGNMLPNTPDFALPNVGFRADGVNASISR